MSKSQALFNLTFGISGTLYWRDVILREVELWRQRKHGEIEMERVATEAVARINEVWRKRSDDCIGLPECASEGLHSQACMVALLVKRAHSSQMNDAASRERDLDVEHRGWNYQNWA